jgi:uncharacterized membrane protein
MPKNWRTLLLLLLSHHPKEKIDHTIHAGKNIYLCTRCTGLAAGMATVLAGKILGLTFPLAFYLPLIAFLPLVAVVDWFTQSAKLRESKTWIRLSSGFLLGNSEALALLLLIEGFYLQFVCAVGFAAIYAVSVYLIANKTKCLDSYVKEMMHPTQVS